MIVIIIVLSIHLSFSIFNPVEKLYLIKKSLSCV